MAYSEPVEVAYEMAKAFADLDQNDRAELGRIASLVETFAEPFSSFTPLLAYARSMGYEARGDTERAVVHLAPITKQGSPIQFLGVDLPIPVRVREQMQEKAAGEWLKEPLKPFISIPETRELQTEEGDALYNVGNYEDALVSYERMLSSNPISAFLYVCKGNTLRHLNRQSEALAAYEHALQLDESLAAAYVGKGDALCRLNRQSEALAAYEHALQLDESLAAAYAGKGDALCRLKSAVRSTVSI